MVRWHTLVLLFVAAVSVRGEDNLAVLRLGERFFSDSLYNLALEQYQKYLTLPRAPEQDPAAYYRIAQSHFRMGNMQRAAESFEEYLRLFPGHENTMEAMYQAAEAYRSTGDLRKASEWYHSVWSRFVGSARAQQALYESAVAAQEYGALERAIELLDLYVRRFQKSPRASTATLLLARLHLDKKEYVRVAQVLEAGDKLWSKDKGYLVRSLYLRAAAARATRRNEEAATLFAAMFSIEQVEFPELREAYRDYIAFLKQTEDYRTCLAVYARLREHYRQSGEALTAHDRFEWAECARRALSWNEAYELYSALLTSGDPSQVRDEQVRFRLAEVLAGKGDFSRAIETLQSLAADESAGDFVARALLKTGDLFYQREMFLGAIPAYRSWLQMDGQRNRDMILFRIGSIYQHQFSQYGTALREYETLLRTYPSSPLYHQCVFAMAGCYEELDRIPEALQYYGYLLEAGVQGELSEQARDRIRYLSTFRVRDTDAAVYAVARQTERLLSGDAAHSPVAGLVELAATYERHLKDHQRALELYKKVSNTKNVPDSLRALAEFRVARNLEYLGERAAFEDNPQTAAHYREQAVARYREVIGEQGDSALVQEAAFRLMMLSGPGIVEFERYLTTYPASAHLDEVLYRIARYYEERVPSVDARFAAQALDAYKGIVSRTPAGPHAARAQLGIARNALSMGAVDTTEHYVNLLLERFADSDLRPEALYLKGLVQKRRRDVQGSIETFRTVLYQYPFSSFAQEARFELGSALFAADGFFEAADLFRGYLDAHPDGPHRARAMYHLGRSLVRIGRLDEAQQLFVSLLSDSIPPQVRSGVRHEQARIAQERGDLFEALRHYRTVLDDPSYAHKGVVYPVAGQLYFDNRLYADAETVFRQGLAQAATAGDSLVNHTGLVKSLIMGGKGRDADRELKSFRSRYGEQRREFVDILYHEGLYLLAEKRYDQARNRFQFIVSRHPQSGLVDAAAYQAALAQYYAGDGENALARFNEFATRYPGSTRVPSALFKQGMIYHEREEYALAAQYFMAVSEHALADSSIRYRALHNAAVDFQRSSAWGRAAETYLSLIDQFPDPAQESSLRLKTGFSLVQANRFEDALVQFALADSNPAPADKPEILYWTGICHAHLGNYQAAITQFLKVPYLYSGVGKWGITAEFEAARLYERLNEFERAKVLYRKIVNSDGERGEFGKRALAQLQRIETLVR